MRVDAVKAGYCIHPLCVYLKIKNISRTCEARESVTKMNSVLLTAS